MLALIGGFVCGFAAGAAARYGRICSMSAIEDALLAKDYRGAKAWGLALVVAIVLTQLLSGLSVLDISSTIYGSARLDLLGAILGGGTFGFGMALIGTCSFGLLVRAGSGDMRAVVSSAIVGISAFAFTAGVLAPVRLLVSGIATVDVGRFGGPLLPGVLSHYSGARPLVSALIVVLLAVVAPLVLVVSDRRLWRRPRMLVGATGLGAAVAAGWLVTSIAVERLEMPRPESLSFVAPVGRLLLQVMTDSVRDVGFGVSAVMGVMAGAMSAAALKNEVRWEAFDDVREMRRHCLGAVLMGLGGVLAHGCTIGQGMSAASVLAVSAPVVVLSILVGAKLGLSLLLEGRAMWRLGSGS